MKTITLILSLVMICHLSFSQSCLPEGIEFWSQVQIDSFYADYPGCTEIEGDVLISSGSGITNLDGLSMVNSIGGYLKIHNNTALADLTGLEGLTTVGSDLWIYSNSSMLNFTGLENLQSIGGLLHIVYNPDLQDITGIQSLDAATLVDLTIKDNPSLSDCSVQGICDYLSAPNGIVRIYNNADGCSNPPDIARSCNMQMPCLPFGSYYFTTQAEIDSFSTDYPGCDQLNSFVDISGNDIDNLSGLSGIISINGTFSVSDNLVLVNLEGLENLDSITEDLFISDNNSLVSLAGLESLSYLKGSLVVHFNTVLNSLDGLVGLDTVSGNVDIGDNENLASLEGLNNVVAIKCHLLISNNPMLENLDGLEHLNFLGLSLHIGGNDSLNNITGLSNLASIGEEFWIGYNDNLQNLNGLEELNSIGDYLIITENITMTELSGLDSLTSIGGFLQISDNNALTSLDALQNLISIGGGITISRNESLTSLSGLDNINAGTISGLLIHQNSSLSTCDVKSICDYLSDPNGSLDINNNAEGCDNEQEVIEACVTGVEQFDSTTLGQLDMSVYPNPAGKMVEFRVSSIDSQSGRVMLKIYDVQGREMVSLLDEKNLPGEYTLPFDVSILQPGIYFYRLTSGGLTTGGKLIIMR